MNAGALQTAHEILVALQAEVLALGHEIQGAYDPVWFVAGLALLIVERFVGVPVQTVSVGPDRQQTITRDC